MKSPYLWAFSNHYTRGKYVADGRWSETAVSRQAGAATLLRRMAERGLVGWEKTEGERPFLRYSEAGPVPHARDLQVFLNRLPGIHLKTDGWPGPRTSEAFKRATGYYLLGDPRANT